MSFNAFPKIQQFIDDNRFEVKVNPSLFNVQSVSFSIADIGGAALSLLGPVSDIIKIAEAQNQSKWAIKKQVAEYYIGERNYATQLSAAAKNMERQSVVNMKNIQHYDVQKGAVTRARDYAKTLSEKQIVDYRKAVLAQIAEVTSYVSASGMQGGGSEVQKATIAQNIKNADKTIAREDAQIKRDFNSANLQIKNIEMQKTILGNTNALLAERAGEYRKMADEIDPYNTRYWDSADNSVISQLFSSNAKARSQGAATLAEIRKSDPVRYASLMKVINKGNSA